MSYKILQYSCIFRYIIIFFFTPFIHRLYSVKVEPCECCNWLITLLIISIVLSGITIINILLVLFNNYICKKSSNPSLSYETLKKIKRYQMAIILLFFLLTVLNFYYKFPTILACLLLLSIGIIPIPYCALIDILLFLEKEKNAIKRIT